MINKVQNFIGEVVTEMKKVSWITRQELIDSTIIVVIAAVLLGVFVTIVDLLLSKGISVLIK